MLKQIKCNNIFSFNEFSPKDFKDFENSLKYGREQLLMECFQLQIAIFVMVGGGILGSSAAKQPYNFDFDDRTSPVYPKEVILQVVKILLIYAKVLELDPNNLKPLPNIYNDLPSCGVF